MVSEKLGLVTNVRLKPVLILVLMADGLSVYAIYRIGSEYDGLNPCSNGRWSLRRRIFNELASLTRLNPCSNGRWSLRLNLLHGSVSLASLNPCSNGRWSLRFYYFL